jgi:cardiolipin synthase A/B
MTRIALKENSMDIFTPPAYADALVKDVESANHRVMLFSHIIGYDTSTKRLVDALCDAAKRGVYVEVASDVFTYGIMGGWKSTPLRADKRIRALRTMARKFKRSGVKFQWIGQLGPILFAGRMHLKWCVVDDKVYGFGGINLYEEGLQHADYMFGGRDAKLGDRIAEEHERIVRANRLGKVHRSYQFQSLHGTVLVDGGKMGDSIIYKRACQLARQARDITFVSQYCPTGKLGKIMHAKGAKLYFSHWRLAHNFNRFLIRVSMAATGYQTSYRRQKYIHAKCIIYTMPDGRKVALTGTHNFVRAGVALGTREIALETSDPHIVAQLEEFLAKYIY